MRLDKLLMLFGMVPEIMELEPTFKLLRDKTAIGEGGGGLRHKAQRRWNRSGASTASGTVGSMHEVAKLRLGTHPKPVKLLTLLGMVPTKLLKGRATSLRVTSTTLMGEGGCGSLRLTMGVRARA